jgi:hypothetical protein
MGLHQIKKLPYIKGNHYQNQELSPMNGRKIFASYLIDKGLISRTYQVLNKLNSKKLQIN